MLVVSNHATCRNFFPLIPSTVDVYVVDTGIFLGHADFGGRAVWGWTAPGMPSADGNGHGTQ